MKVVDKMEDRFKEIKADIFRINHNVESHDTTI